MLIFAMVCVSKESNKNIASRMSDLAMQENGRWIKNILHAYDF